MAFGRFVSRLVVAGVSGVVALVAAEGLLRALVPPFRGYFVLPPGADWTFTPPPGWVHGIEGISHFRVNRFGIRGRTFGDDHTEFRILAVGGSTTRCAVLDETEVWTHLLEVKLGRTADGRGTWVGNVGKDGATTRDHVLHLKYLLPQYPRIDVVVSLVGMNDVMSALQRGWQYRPPAPVTEPAAEREQTPRAFVRVPGRLQDPLTDDPHALSWYKATALWQLGKRAKQALQLRRTVRLEDAPRLLAEARHRRQTAPTWFDSLPSLDAPLFEYRRNLNTMADLARAAGVRLVLVTQPSVWRQGMSPAEQRTLVYGEVQTVRQAYYTPGALARAMAQYNATLLRVCRERALECVDAASLVPRDTTTMYDDVHFTERGSRLLAQLLADYFGRHSPFR